MTDVVAFFVVVWLDSVLKELKDKGEKSSLGTVKVKTFAFEFICTWKVWGSAFVSCGLHIKPYVSV